MTTKENLDFPLTVTKRFIKERLGDDVLLSTEFAKSFGKSLRVFIHYLMTISDDITKEKKKGLISVNEVEAAIKEMGLENLFETAGKAPKLETKKKIKKDKATLDVTQETIPSQMEEDHHGEDKIQEENIPTQPIDDMEINKETSHSQPEGEIIMSK